MNQLIETEQTSLRWILSTLEGYLDVLRRSASVQESYAIAGVGGILRRKDPSSARDIDLVVSGLPLSVLEVIDKTAAESLRFKRWGIPYIIFGFLEKLAATAGVARIEQPVQFSFESSVPFKDFNRTVVCPGGLKIHSLIDTEEGGLLSNFRGRAWLGVKVVPSQGRPFDVIFALGMSVNDWTNEQATQLDHRVDTAEMRPDYPYSFLVKALR